MSNTVIAVVAATAAQFAVGAFWYTALFSKVWGKIHGFDKLPKAKQQEMMSQMGPIYGIQLGVTVIAAAVLAQLIQLVPDYSPYGLATLLWLGFIVPTQASSVLFSNDKPEWMHIKFAIQAGGSLACILAGAAVLQALL